MVEKVTNLRSNGILSNALAYMGHMWVLSSCSKWTLFKALVLSDIWYLAIHRMNYMSTWHINRVISGPFSVSFSPKTVETAFGPISLLNRLSLARKSRNWALRFETLASADWRWQDFPLSWEIFHLETTYSWNHGSSGFHSSVVQQKSRYGLWRIILTTKNVLQFSLHYTGKLLQFHVLDLILALTGH